MPDDDAHPAPRPAGMAVACACGAYLIWGVVGLYFKYVTQFVGPFTLLAHRVVWSLAFVAIVLAIRGELGAMVAALRSRRLVIGLSATSLLIGCNWIAFIYAAHTGRLVQASLGYFLTPLMSVLLGVALLGERLRRGQTAAIALAGVGVGIVCYLKFGSIWIPLTLMVSFSLYGLLRKRIAVGPIVGLAVETAVLSPMALAYVCFAPEAAHGPIDAHAYGLLVAAGVITAIPLMLFAYAARRLTLVTIGLLQYLGPTVQFVVARYVAHESVSRGEVIAFAIIWAGLIVFAIETARAARRGGAGDAPPLAPGVPAAIGLGSRA